MTQTVEQALSQAKFYSDGVDYAFVRLPPAAITPAAAVIAEIGEPFCALIVDKDEVTMMIPADALAHFGRRLPEHVKGESAYRLITIDVVLEPDLVGFMAHVSVALASAGITLMPFAAYSRDHLLVPAEKLDLALKTLEKLRK